MPTLSRPKIINDDISPTPGLPITVVIVVGLVFSLCLAIAGCVWVSYLLDAQVMK